MPLMPKRVKYRKAQRGRMRGTSHAGAELNFAECGLKALENAWVRDRQIEAACAVLLPSELRLEPCGR